MKPATPRHYAALAVSILLNSSTLILLKIVALTELATGGLPSFADLVTIALSPAFLLAVALFLAGVFFWIVALRRLDLSLAYPSVSASYVLIALVSWWLFDERIGVWGWIGIAAIMSGVTLMFASPGASQTQSTGDG